MLALAGAEVLLALTISLATRKFLPAVAIQMNLQAMLKAMAEVTSTEFGQETVSFPNISCSLLKSDMPQRGHPGAN